MMARMPLVATAALSPATLHEAFSAAFADYLIPLALTPSQWDGFLRRQGVDLDLGRALLEGGEVQGLALVAPRPAIGRWRLATMGLRPAARGSGAAATLIDDLPLFRATPVAPPPKVVKASEVEDRLKAVHPDELTPIEALRLVYDLKRLADQST